MRSAFGIVPVIAAAATSAASLVGSGLNVAEQIAASRQAREQSAVAAATQARVQAWQLQQGQYALAQQAALEVRRQQLIGRLVPVGLLALVVLGVLLVAGRRRSSSR